MTELVSETVRSGANLELKARVLDLARCRERVHTLGAVRQGDEWQADQYYRVPRGRLKLRISSLDGAHLILYLRSDDPGVSVSTFHRLPVERGDELRNTLGSMLETRATVEKEREVWWWRDVRIHLDRVTGLGAFVEFEARLDRIGDAVEAERRIEALREHLEIEPGDLLGGSYGDMIEALD